MENQISKGDMIIFKILIKFREGDTEPKRCILLFFKVWRGQSLPKFENFLSSVNSFSRKPIKPGGMSDPRRRTRLDAKLRGMDGVNYGERIERAELVQTLQINSPLIDGHGSAPRGLNGVKID